VVFNFLCWAVRKFHFWGISPPRRTPKFGRNNCLSCNFLHCEFQLSMLSSSKVSFRDGHFWGIRPQNLVQLIVSQTSSYNVSFNFLCWAVQKFHFGGFAFPGGSINLVQTVVPHCSVVSQFCYVHKQLPILWVSTFLCSAVLQFNFGKANFWGRSSPPRGPLNLVQTIISETSSYFVSFNFLCWAVRMFYFFGGSLPLKDPQIWSK